MKIGVIGAGAAGLIAGAFAAKGGARVDIIDRNEKTGKNSFLRERAGATSPILPISMHF